MRKRAPQAMIRADLSSNTQNGVERCASVFVDILSSRRLSYVKYDSTRRSVKRPVAALGQFRPAYHAAPRLGHQPVAYIAWPDNAAHPDGVNGRHRLQPAR